MPPISALEPLLDDGDDGSVGIGIGIGIGVVLLVDDDHDVPPSETGEESAAQVLDQPEIDAIERKHEIIQHNFDGDNFHLRPRGPGHYLHGFFKASEKKFPTSTYIMPTHI